MTATERARRTAEADLLCAAAYEKAGGSEVGAALVAVGGYGRAELAPYSDLDVVLVADEGVELGEVAERVWYPLWDSGSRLDHSVRSFPEMVATADADLKVALGLLDLRHLAGDPNLTLRLRATMLTGWRRRARTRLPELREMVRARHDLLGELAHLSVPDLKEAEGGLRDATALNALVASWLVDVPHADLERCRGALLNVRDVLHATAGRATDRIAPELWGELAEGLGLDDDAAAQRHVRELGRRITHLSRLTWRRVDGVLARPGSTRGVRRPVLDTLVPGHCAVGRRGRPGHDRAPGRRPAAAPARGRPGRRARRRARARDGRPAGARGGSPARPLALGGAAPVRPAPRLGAGTAAGLGDPGRDRRAGRDPARVGADPDAAARLVDPPVHRRPPRRGDLHRGVGADPRRRPPRRADGGGAAARHRQGRPDRAQRGGGAAGAGDRGPDGVRPGGRGADRHPGALAPAAGRDRDHPRPRRPGDGAATWPSACGPRQRPSCWRC